MLKLACSISFHSNLFFVGPDCFPFVFLHRFNSRLCWKVLMGACINIMLIFCRTHARCAPRSKYAAADAAHATHATDAAPDAAAYATTAYATSHAANGYATSYASPYESVWWWATHGLPSYAYASTLQMIRYSRGNPISWIQPLNAKWKRKKNVATGWLVYNQCLLLGNWIC